MSIKLAFSRPTSTVEEQTLLFQQYRAVGYDGLQLKGPQYGPYLNEPERFKEAWGQLPGVGSALITGGRLDEAGTSSLGKYFGLPPESVRIWSYTAMGFPELKLHLRIFVGMGMRFRNWALKRSSSTACKLSLHHHHNNPVMYREDFDIFFDRIQDQSIGLTVDTAHLVKSGVHDVAELIRSFGHVIDNFHLKDFEQGDWKVLGEGAIDFKPIFGAIKAINYKGWMSADEESGGEVLEGMKACYAYMRNGLK